MATGAWANEQKQACHHQLAKLHPEVTKDVGTPAQAQATAGPWAWAHLQRQACHRQLAKLHPEVIKGGVGYGGARKVFYFAELTTVLQQYSAVCKCQMELEACVASTSAA